VHTDPSLAATKTAAEKAESGELNCINQNTNDVVHIKPSYIEGLGFEGEEDWQLKPLGILPRTNKTGSVTQEPFLDIIVHFFNIFPKAVKGKPVILAVDGHQSCWSLASINYALAHNVFMFYLPGHSSIWSQPNDMVPNQCFHTVL